MQILEILTKNSQTFLDEKKASSKSKNTLRAYTLILEDFYEYVANELDKHENLTIFDINRYFLNNYIIWLNERKLQKSSQLLHITIIKQFLTHIADSDIKLYGKIKTKISGVKVKIEQKESESFNQDEQNRIIAYIKILDQSKNFTAHRNALILKMLLFHGVRIDELINLQSNNVSEEYDETDGYVYRFIYTGKGAKERSLDFPIPFIENNLNIIKKHISSNYVVPSSTGGIMSQGNIFKSVKNILAKLGINKYGLHIFRHTFGDNNAAMNVNLAVMSKLMGHSNTSITSKYYVRVSNKTKRDAVFKGIEKFTQNKNQ
ncbi:MAG: tyrosine-type recombinase/integrase [Burkholderiales bacterium]|nr:tyrosine-type recombinase/integrase [Burkholderiales bacterium]